MFILVLFPLFILCAYYIINLLDCQALFSTFFIFLFCPSLSRTIQVYHRPRGKAIDKMHKIPGKNLFILLLDKSRKKCYNGRLGVKTGAHNPGRPAIIPHLRPFVNSNLKIFSKKNNVRFVRTSQDWRLCPHLRGHASVTLYFVSP